MSRRRRAIAGNAILLLFSVSVALAVCELCLRWFRPQPLEAAYVWPDGTLRHLPSFRFRYSRGEFSNIVSYNAIGFRGPAPDAAGRPGATRLLVLGDSFVEGKHVADDEVLTSVLERLAAGRGAALEVINTGVAGCGTAEELILWDRFAHTLEPDLVLLGFYPNDVRNNVDRRFFNLVDGRPVADREPPLPKNRMAYDIRKTLASRSHLYVLFKLWLDTLETPEEGASAPLEAEDVFARSPSPRVVRGWELTLALLDELRAQVEAGGGRFAVVLFPTRYQVDDVLWAAGVLRKRLDTDAYDLRAPQKRLGAWAEATGAVLIDLLDEFRSRNTSNSFYYEVDAHWNPAGHRLAAELILDGLVERGLLAVPHVPPTSSTPDP